MLSTVHTYRCCIEYWGEEFDENAQQHLIVLKMEASGGGRRSSQLLPEHFIAYEGALIIVILTNQKHIETYYDCAVAYDELYTVNFSIIF